MGFAAACAAAVGWDADVEAACAGDDDAPAEGEALEGRGDMRPILPEKRLLIDSPTARRLSMLRMLKPLLLSIGVKTDGEASWGRRAGVMGAGSRAEAGVKVGEERDAAAASRRCMRARWKATSFSVWGLGFGVRVWVLGGAMEGTNLSVWVGEGGGAGIDERMAC